LSELPEGADASAAKREVEEAVRQHFRPEFLNRLDEQIIFDRLDRGDMRGIVEIQLKRLEQRLAGRKITLDLDESAKQWLADEGYDPVFGARPLKRVIQRALQDQLAEMILAGEVRDEETVHVTAGTDGLVVGNRVAPAAHPRASAGPERPVVVH
jgi:ATP-dependent Clp protease ATP-binding subunit ClpB